MELVRAGDRRILFIMAAPPEYGPALRARFSPLMTGVGPVEAGLAVGATLARLETRGETPDLAVCLGSAGSRSLEQTGVYQVASVSYRDIDASPLGIPAGLKTSRFSHAPGLTPGTIRGRVRPWNSSSPEIAASSSSWPHRRSTARPFAPVSRP